jgi:lysozyme
MTVDRALGVDVSHWKPVVDWKALKAGGVSFVGMKTMEGQSYVDPEFKNHIRGFRQNDFLLGIYYHFARSGNPTDQARRFMATVGPLEDNEMLCLDFEVIPEGRQAPHAALDWINRFYDAIFEEYPSRRTLIYTSKRIWRMLGNEDYVNTWEFAKYIPRVDLWAPRYNDKGVEPEIPAPWKSAGLSWTFWQWTDGDFPPKITPGIGRCDANWFNGSELALKEYVSRIRE